MKEASKYIKKAIEKTDKIIDDKIQNNMFPEIQAKINMDLAISVEIESQAEVMSHPAHVLYNMEKWPNLGFDECHVWSLSPKIKEIKEKLQNKDIKEKVHVFVLKTKDDADRDN